MVVMVGVMVVMVVVVMVASTWRTTAAEVEPANMETSSNPRPAFWIWRLGLGTFFGDNTMMAFCFFFCDRRVHVLRTVHRTTHVAKATHSARLGR